MSALAFLIAFSSSEPYFKFADRKIPPPWEISIGVERYWDTEQKMFFPSSIKPSAWDTSLG
jgi:hypothetical protein